MKTIYPLTKEFAGYGHFKITTTHYGKTISCITTNTMALDDWFDDSPKRQAYIDLRNEIIRANS